jgi:hypothetical protein
LLILKKSSSYAVPFNEASVNPYNLILPPIKVFYVIRVLGSDKELGALAKWLASRMRSMSPVRLLYPAPYSSTLLLHLDI